MAQLFRLAVLAGLMLDSTVLAQSSPKSSPLRRTAWTTSRMAGTPVPPAPYRIRPAFPEVRFDHPTSLQEIPGQDRLLVTEMSGKIFSLSKSVATAKPELIIDLEKHTGSQVSVIGGPVYRGNKLTELQGAFVYGDYIIGTIWALWPDATTSEPTKTFKHATLVDTDLQIVSFSEGSAGELYVLDYDFTGQIYELLPSGLKDNSAKFPRKLSETGLFKSLDDLEPSPGVVPYSVTVSRWMDGADASRWIAIPGLGSVDLSVQDQGRAFSDGTVLVKHLSLPIQDKQPIRLETQLLHLHRYSV